MHRRHFIMAGTLACLSMDVHAQTLAAFPSRPVKIVVGFPAGQATDTIARLVSEKLTQILGQAFIVENKPGAGGGLALAYLAQQPSDGHTVSFANTGAVITSRFIRKSLPYRPEQLLPVALLGDVPLVLVTQSGSKIDNLQDFIARARANPGALTYSTPGTGTTSHLAMESLKQAAGIDVLHIPYTGSSRSLADLVAGNVDVSFDSVTTVRPLVAGGRLRALAIGASTRVALLPEVPTLLELGYRDIIGAFFIGAFVQQGTPESVVKILETAMAQLVRDPAMSARLADTGLYVRYADAAGYAAVLDEDMSKIKRVVELSGIKPD